MGFIVIVTIFFVVLTCVTGETCPPIITTRPCKCTEEEGLTLQCWNLTAIDILGGVARRTGSIKFQKLQIFESKVPIPHSFLVSKQIRSVDLAESNFTASFLDVIQPRNSNVVEAVHLYSARFERGITWRQFSGLAVLRFLLVYKVDIGVLDLAFRLHVSKNLERLHFWKTETAFIEGGVFVGFNKLMDVRIQHGRIKELKRSYFPNPSNIEILFFDGNQIEKLPVDIFQRMPHLRSVDLSKNLLTTVSESVFKQVYPHLGDLSLSGNPIVCNCHISWIVPLQGHRYLDGYCVSPESLKERSLVTLKQRDFQFCTQNDTVS